MVCQRRSQLLAGIVQPLIAASSWDSPLRASGTGLVQSSSKFPARAGTARQSCQVAPSVQVPAGRCGFAIAVKANCSAPSVTISATAARRERCPEQNIFRQPAGQAGPPALGLVGWIACPAPCRPWSTLACSGHPGRDATAPQLPHHHHCCGAQRGLGAGERHHRLGFERRFSRAVGPCLSPG